MSTMAKENKLSFCVPATLNFAVFTRNLLNLHATTPSHMWPDCDSSYTDLDGSTIIKEWNCWWENLIKERSFVVQQKSTLSDYLCRMECKPNVADVCPTLQAAIDMTWPPFNKWWNYPYIGGKMALESVPAARASEFSNELILTDSEWVFDIVYQLCEGRTILQKHGANWGIIEPNDLWDVRWVKDLSGV